MHPFLMLKYFDDSHNIATLTQIMARVWRQDYLFVQPMEDGKCLEFIISGTEITALTL